MPVMVAWLEQELRPSPSEATSFQHPILRKSYQTYVLCLYLHSHLGSQHFERRDVIDTIPMCNDGWRHGSA